MTPDKLAAEAALAALLFGGDGGADVEADVEKHSKKKPSARNRDGDGGGEALFSIDREGVDVGADGAEDASGSGGDEERGACESEDESSDDEVGQQAVSTRGAAWRDDDEERQSSDDEAINNAVSLVEGPRRIKKLRRFRDEADPVSIKEYELRLRERFVGTAGVAARTDWANVAKVLEGDGTRKKFKPTHSDDSEKVANPPHHLEPPCTSLSLSHHHHYHHELSNQQPTPLILAHHHQQPLWLMLRMRHTETDVYNNFNPEAAGEQETYKQIWYDGRLDPESVA